MVPSTGDTLHDTAHTQSVARTMTPQSARGHSGVITRDGDTEVNSTKTRRALSRPILSLIVRNSLRFAVELCVLGILYSETNSPRALPFHHPGLRRPPATQQLPKALTSATSHRPRNGTPRDPAQLSTIRHPAVSLPEKTDTTVRSHRTTGTFRILAFRNRGNQ